MKAFEIAKEPLVPGVPNLVVIGAKSAADEALAMMSKFKIHHLLVRREDATYALVSDRDFFSRAIEGGNLVDLRTVKVEDVMHIDVPTCDETTELRDALALMTESRSSALIITRENTISGLLTETDFLRALQRLLSHASPLDRLETESKMVMANPLSQSIASLLSAIGI